MLCSLCWLDWRVYLCTKIHTTQYHRQSFTLNKIWSIFSEGFLILLLSYATLFLWEQMHWFHFFLSLQSPTGPWSSTGNSQQNSSAPSLQQRSAVGQHGLGGGVGFGVVVSSELLPNMDSTQVSALGTKCNNTTIHPHRSIAMSPLTNYWQQVGGGPMSQMI